MGKTNQDSKGTTPGGQSSDVEDEVTPQEEQETDDTLSKGASSPEQDDRSLSSDQSTEDDETTFPAKVVRDLRQENKNLRKRLREANKSLGDVEAARKTDVQSVTALQEQVEKLEDAVIDSAIMAEAVRMGFVDPTDAVVLVGSAAIQLKDGKAQGVVEALEALAASKPHLVRSADSPKGDKGSGFGGSRQQTQRVGNVSDGAQTEGPEVWLRGRGNPFGGGGVVPPVKDSDD